jgi:uncharacterized membrane protein
MKQNMHAVDRLVRAVVVAPLAVWLAVAVGMGTVLGVVALVFAAIMVATGVSGFCPLYTLVGRLSRGHKLA